MRKAATAARRAADPAAWRRRELIHAGVASAAGLAATLLWRPAHATPDGMKAAIDHFTGGMAARLGQLELQLSPLVENGNAVPVTLRMASPMTALSHVRRMALFTQRNPQPEVAVFHLSPASGVAQVSTRMRLATSQTVVALAELNDGSCWQHSIDVLVTLAACIEN